MPGVGDELRKASMALGAEGDAHPATRAMANASAKSLQARNVKGWVFHKAAIMEYPYHRPFRHEKYYPFISGPDNPY